MNKSYVSNRQKRRFDHDERYIIHLTERNNVNVNGDLFGATFTYPINDFLNSSLNTVVDEFALLFSGDIPVHQGIILKYDHNDPLRTLILHYGANENNDGPVVETLADVIRIASGEVTEITVYDYSCYNQSSVDSLTKYLYLDARGNIHANQQELNKLYGVISNGTYKYDILTCNCQHFVDAVLLLNHYNQGSILSDAMSLYKAISEMINNTSVLHLISGTSQ